MYLYLSISIYLFISIYLSYLSIYLFIYLSIYLSIAFPLFLIALPHIYLYNKKRTIFEYPVYKQQIYWDLILKISMKGTLPFTVYILSTEATFYSSYFVYLNYFLWYISCPLKLLFIIYILST